MSKDFRIPCTGRGYAFSRDSFIDLAFKQFGLPITDYSTKQIKDNNIISEDIINQKTNYMNALKLNHLY